MSANSSRRRQTPAPRQSPIEQWRYHIKEAEAAREGGALDGALAHAIPAARLAERVGRPQPLRRTGRALESLSLWGPAARLMAIAERIEAPDGPPEWDGAPRPDATLLIVERRGEHIGRPLRFARFIPMAAARAKHCIVLAEPRLVELFRRSFPGVEVHPHGADDAKAYARADAVAGYHTLIRHFGFDDQALRGGFSTLSHDRVASCDLRARYGAEARPLIGLSWMSTNAKKQVPSLADWAGFMQSFDATYVSLQYGDLAEDVAMLREASGRSLVCDDRVDSLRDLDIYAAQVAAMDAVVTISGTCVHMAGALGRPTFVPLDDTTRLYWPASGNSISWYPSVTFDRRDGRPWADVFARVRSRIAAQLCSHGTAKQHIPRPMDYATFFSRFGGSARTKHVLPVDAGIEERTSKREKRPFRLPSISEMPKEFIRLCPWEVEYLFAIARRARIGIVETGRFNGGSLFVMACAAPETVPIYSIDRRPRDDAFLRQKLDQFCPHRRIELIVGDSQRGSYPQIDAIGLLFIDGDHSYEGCLNDIQNWYGRLVDNGHLIFHDSYLGPHGVQDAIADFMETHPELEVIKSPFIGATHWAYPTGSIAHLIKRGPAVRPAES